MTFAMTSTIPRRDVAAGILRALLQANGRQDSVAASTDIPAVRLATLNRLSSGVHGVATQVSQLGFFKASFANVLTALVS